MLFLPALQFRLALGLLFALLRLPFALLSLPFLLLRFVVKSLVLLAVLPFVLLAVGAAMIVAVVAGVFAVVIPLAPLPLISPCVSAIVPPSRPAPGAPL